MKHLLLLILVQIGCSSETSVIHPYVDAGYPDVILSSDELILCPTGNMTCEGALLLTCSEDQTYFEVMEICPSSDQCDPVVGVCLL